MKRLVLLFVGAAIAGALVVYLRRRNKTTPAPAAAPSPEATLPVDPNRPGAAPSGEAREQESAATDDTRFDRLAEEERQKRREAVTRVQAHPPPEGAAGGEAGEG
jgi:hypothetical protein